MVLIQDLESIRNDGQQTNNFVAELEGQLKERQTYISQLNENIKIMEQGFNSQIG